MTRTMLMLVCMSSVAMAAPERPWASGVSAPDQELALSVFRDANVLFEQSKYSQALARYREALKTWDHPAIRYNTAVALINLDQPLEAFENLEAALRFADAPFDAETFKQAQLYRKLLAGQVAEIEVVCAEPGAEVLLDGARLFIAPGTHRLRLKPGPHQLVARKEGFVTETAVLQLESGVLHREEVSLKLPSAAQVRLVRRFPVWVPWSVLGAGVVTAILGAPLMAAAQSSFNTFDSDLARLCPEGCTQSTLPKTILDARSTGRVENGVAIALFAVGGAAVATGVVLLSLNGLRAESEPTFAVLPVFGPGVFGLNGTMHF